MTKQEYIDRGNLVSITHALSILGHITPEISFVIDSKEFIRIIISLQEWREKLYQSIHVD